MNGEGCVVAVIDGVGGAEHASLMSVASGAKAYLDRRRSVLGPACAQSSSDCISADGMVGKRIREGNELRSMVKGEAET